jgi:DNA polymerase V
MITHRVLRADHWPKLYLPLFLEKISAGFPSPAQDYVEQRLDLNEFCVKRPAATYFVRVAGDSMIEAGIYPDDLLVVDRSINAQAGDIVIARIHRQRTSTQPTTTDPEK